MPEEAVTVLLAADGRADCGNSPKSLRVWPQPELGQGQAVTGRESDLLGRVLASIHL